MATPDHAGSDRVLAPFTEARALQPRLMLVGASVVGVIDAAGGWMVDRGRAGWRVTVAIADIKHVAALTILGADWIRLDDVMNDETPPWPRALAVDTKLCQRDAAIRRHVFEALVGDHAEVVLWGERSVPEFTLHVEAVEHRLSAGARAFKAHALAAAGASGDVAAVETFHAGRSPSRYQAADLYRCAEAPTAPRTVHAVDGDRRSRHQRTRA